mmetsp:Transcript_46535/g.110779  ORF Transcript_46535/g.110779 Transcript_46535/m.110779 type:complete len:228 (-) Transcript_46535:118-801(-)
MPMKTERVRLSCTRLSVSPSSTIGGARSGSHTPERSTWAITPCGFRPWTTPRWYDVLITFPRHCWMWRMRSETELSWLPTTTTAPPVSKRNSSGGVSKSNMSPPTEQTTRRSAHASLHTSAWVTAERRRTMTGAIPAALAEFRMSPYRFLNSASSMFGPIPIPAVRSSCIVCLPDCAGSPRAVGRKRMSSSITMHVVLCACQSLSGTVTVTQVFARTLSRSLDRAHS